MMLHFTRLVAHYSLLRPDDLGREVAVHDMNRLAGRVMTGHNPPKIEQRVVVSPGRRRSSLSPLLPSSYQQDRWV
jgi:hypothetical protein